MANIPTPAGIPQTARQTSTAPSITYGNVLANNELVITLTIGATNVNSGNNILIIQSLTPYKVVSALSCAVPDQQSVGVKLSSNLNAADTNGLADWNRYINLAGLRIKYIRIFTTDTTLYNKNLNYGIMPYTGNSQPAWFPLGLYAKDSNSGFSKNLIIDTYPDGSPLNMPLTSMTYMYFDTLPTSATVTLTLGVAGDGQNIIN